MLGSDAQREIQARIERLSDMRVKLGASLIAATRDVDETHLLTPEQQRAWHRASDRFGALAWSELTLDQRMLRVAIELEST